MAAMVCFAMTLIASSLVIWHSMSERDEVQYQQEFVATKTAETRDQLLEEVQAIRDAGDEAASTDFEERTPGLRQFLREGKPNSLIYDELTP